MPRRPKKTPTYEWTLEHLEFAKGGTTETIEADTNVAVVGLTPRDEEGASMSPIQCVVPMKDGQIDAEAIELPSIFVPSPTPAEITASSEDSRLVLARQAAWWLYLVRGEEIQHDDRLAPGDYVECAQRAGADILTLVSIALAGGSQGPVRYARLDLRLKGIRDSNGVILNVTLGAPPLK